jgi:hypothetical protein
MNMHCHAWIPVPLRTALYRCPCGQFARRRPDGRLHVYAHGNPLAARLAQDEILADRLHRWRMAENDLRQRDRTWASLRAGETNFPVRYYWRPYVRALY